MESGTSSGPRMPEAKHWLNWSWMGLLKPARPMPLVRDPTVGPLVYASVEGVHIWRYAHSSTNWTRVGLRGGSRIVLVRIVVLHLVVSGRHVRLACSRICARDNVKSIDAQKTVKIEY
jgi:hypothetical protein